MPSDPFVHLHVHSEYSLLDGFSSVKDIVRTAYHDHSPAVGITDHGSMAGVIQLIEHSQKVGIKPIPGLEAYHVPDRFTKGKVEDGKMNYHLILLATNNIGYQNLMKITSIGHLEGFYRKPRIDNQVLAQYSEGIVATTACLGGMVNQSLVQGNRNQALDRAGELKDIFGPDRFFVEVQNHHIPDQLAILEDQVWLSKQLGVGLVATNDSHFTKKEDASPHDALLCMGTGSKVDQEERFRFESDENWIRTSDQMRELFPDRDFPNACSNTLHIADMVDIHVPLNENHLIPQFPVPEKSQESVTITTPHSYLSELVQSGARSLYGNDDGNIPDKVQERIHYELNIIRELEFSDYFLILSDAIKWAKARGIAVGPGRGSAAGSIVSYCVDITTVDPVRHGLFFERFLNPGRKSMPDIDVDFEPDRRTEVQQYLVRKYGSDRVSHIGTYDILRPKSALKNSAKVLDLPIGDKLSSTYPKPVSQVTPPIPVIMERKKSNVDEQWLQFWKNGSDFRDLYDSDNRAKQVIDLAEQVEGTVQTASVHAAAILITPEELTNYVPLRSTNMDDIPVAEYDKNEVESIGGLKIDVLGLINLRVIQRAVELIRQDLGRRIDIEQIPLDDPNVYQMLSNGDTEGIFQLESSGMRELVTQLRPDRFADIAALIALYRPGPMGSNVHIEYANRKNGRSRIQAVHPDMLEILNETYGLTVYQEQVMSMSMHFAGYSATEADNFRKAMSKKNIDAMSAQYEQFMNGCEAQGYTRELAQQLWDIIEPFSGYAFNKSHAVAYGMISYRTAWLRAHYPAQYSAACIDYMPRDRVPLQVESSRKRGIQVYAPDINKSDVGTSTSESSIWLGLGGIAHCGHKPINNILAQRSAEGDFADLGDFLVRTRGLGVNKNAIINLVHAGSFDSLHESRRAMVENIPEMVDAASRLVSSSSVENEEESLFGIEEDVGNSLSGFDLEGEDYTSRERSINEMSVLGFYVGQHPFTLVRNKIPVAQQKGIIPSEAEMATSELSASSGNTVMYGIIANLTTSKSKNGKPYSKFTLEAGYGSAIPVFLFGKTLDKRSIGYLVTCSGKIKEDVSPNSDESTITLAANDVQVVNLDDVQEHTPRPNLQVVGSTTRSSSSTKKSRRDQEKEETNTSQKQDFSNQDGPQEISGCTFYPRNDLEVKSLRDCLVTTGSGDVPIVISYQGEQIRHPSLSFSLDREKVYQIASEVGVDFHFH